MRRHTDKHNLLIHKRKKLWVDLSARNFFAEKRKKLQKKYIESEVKMKIKYFGLK